MGDHEERIKQFKDSTTNNLFPAESDYTPKLNVDDWVELLNDESVFTPSSLEIMKRG